MSAAHDTHEEDTHGPKILAEHTSSAGKVVRSVQVVRPEAQDTTFLAAGAKGFGITLKHFAKNLFLPLRKKAAREQLGAPVGDLSWKNEIETVQYPEEKVEY